MPKRTPPPCPNAAQHTPHPSGYVTHAVWAEEMLRTHRQVRCPSCALYEIWKPIPGAPDLPSVEYRMDHKSCMCCDGDPDCDCRYHQPSGPRTPHAGR